MNLCIDSKYVSDFQCKYHKNGVYQRINELVYQRVYESEGSRASLNSKYKAKMLRSLPT